jgi:tetratricopeptide (TPR) repeat protein
LVIGSGVAGTWWYWRREFSRANQEAHLSHSEAALTHVRHCLSIRPKHVPTLLLEARLRRVAGDFDAAEEALQRALASQGEANEDIQLEFVLLRAQRGEFDNVEAGLWQCLIQGHPQSPIIAEAMASVYIARLQLSPAFMLVNKWIELDRDNPKAWDWLGWLHENLNHPPSAQAAYRRAGELDPTRIESRARAASYTLMSGDVKAAIREYEPLYAAWPDHSMVRVGYARCLMRDMARVPEARAILNETLRTSPDDLDAHIELANLELDYGSPVEAERLLRRAKELDPANATVLAQLATALRKQPGRQADYRKALSESEEVRAGYIRFTQLVDNEVVENPNDPARRVELARFLFKVKRDGLAIFWVRQALGIDPAFRPAHEALYDHYTAAGETAKAAEHKAFLDAATPAAKN